MGKSISVLGLVCVFFIASHSAPADESSVYVRLYSKRVEVAKADLRRQEAETRFQAAHFDRMRRLLEKAAISREEYERAEADYKKSLADEDVDRARIGEEEAMLEVVKQLVQGGQPVPLCRD